MTVSQLAAQCARQQLHCDSQPKRIVIAIPVAPPETCAEFRACVDEVVCSTTPEPFYGVGRWYEDFTQTTDEEVRDLLERASETHSVLPASIVGRVGLNM
jgi:putative phosphoribosyl transferase